MYLYLAYFLALTLSSCYANEHGIVLALFPDGEFNFMLTHHENYELPLVDMYLKKGNEFFIHLLCHKFEINTKSSRVLSQMRASIFTMDDVELDSFKVNDCDENRLKSAIKVRKTSATEKTRVFEIFFKDDRNGCRKRTIQVDKITNEVEPFVGVTRSEVETLPTNWENLCPVTGEGIVMEWFDNGILHYVRLGYELITVWPLRCEKMIVVCGKSNEGKYFADVIVDNVPIERLIVSTCDQSAIKISIQVDLVYDTDYRYKGIYLTYLTTDGRCLLRKYKYDVLYHTDPMYRRAFVERQSINELEDCKTMKAQGFGRYLWLKTSSNFGGLSDKMISWARRSDETDIEIM